METKCSKDRIEAIKRTLRYEKFLVVDSKGRSGGLAMLWKDDIDVQLSTYSQWPISVLIKDKRRGTPMDAHWVLWTPSNFKEVTKLGATEGIAAYITNGMGVYWRFQ